MIEVIKIDRRSNIYWYREGDQYIVTAKIYNREIYRKRLDRKHYNIYHDYINERIRYLIDEDILNREYTMILLDNTMYKVIDNFYFMELNRFLVPVGSLEEDEFKDNLFDLVLDATLRTGEVFDETDLVYHNGIFYIDGIVLATVEDFKRDGIEYEQWDLLNRLTTEQIDYLFYKIYHGLNVIKAKNYITKNINIKIGW